MGIATQIRFGYRRKWLSNGKPGKAFQRKDKAHMLAGLPWRARRRLPIAGKVSKGRVGSRLSGAET